MTDAKPTHGFFVRSPAGDLIAGFETFEEAVLIADDLAKAAQLPALLPGVCWEVVRNPAKRRLRRRVLHRAYPSPSTPGDDGPSGGARGVREPRHPRPSSSSGAIGLELPE
jgi:hypothetical protein